MNSKYLIPVSIFIVCQTVYDFFAPFQSTNWSIFYFASQFFAWLLLLIITPNYANKIKNIPKFVMMLGLSIYIMIEVSKIGMDYEAYYLAVSKFSACILPAAVMITGLTYFIFKTWQR